MNNESNNPNDPHTTGPISLGKDRTRDSNPPYQPFTPQPAFSSPPSEHEGPKRHSKLGVTSFILALVSVVLFIMMIVFGSVFVKQIANSDIVLADPADTAAFEASLQAAIEDLGQEFIVPIMLAIVSLFAAIGISFVGLILGVIGAFSKVRKRVFSVVGIILNGIIVLGTIGVGILGLVMAVAGQA